MIRLFP